MTESGAGEMTISYKEPRNVGQRCNRSAIDSTDYRIVDEQDVDVPAGELASFLFAPKAKTRGLISSAATTRTRLQLKKAGKAAGGIPAMLFVKAITGRCIS